MISSLSGIAFLPPDLEQYREAAAATQQTEFSSVFPSAKPKA
ncbi:uncharacterized protein METZ01_LOCUS170768, partial [marine metagenome]